MNFSRSFRIELLVWLLLLPCLAEARSPRGYRAAATTRTLGHSQRALQMGLDSDVDSGVGVDVDDDDDDDAAPQKAQDKKDTDDEVPEDKKTVDEIDIETDSPTFSPTTLSPTLQPTIAPSISIDNNSPSQILGAKGDPLTDAPTAETAEPTTAATVPQPTVAVTVATTTPAPSRGSIAAEEVAPSSSQQQVLRTPFPSAIVATTSTTTDKPVEPLPEDQSVTVVGSNATEEELPYPIRLEPLYMMVTMQGDDTNEEGFMAVLEGYMEYNMAKDFEGFDSITYGVSTFSMITKYPSVSRAFNGSSSTTVSEFGDPISNVTVHIHMLTATFETKPPDPDLVITEYMEMLLSNEEMLQDYIDTQEPTLDVTIHAVELEFEDTVNPTDEKDGTVDAATSGSAEGSSDDRGSNTMTIVGWTVGAFVALLWVVYLHGIQSRPTA